jgi:hypothetical protein
MTTQPTAAAGELRSRLEADFRRRVTLLYQSLQITPPYHSVEKAVLALRERLQALPDADLRAAVKEPAALFTEIFTESGLAKKNRGIIRRLLADSPDRLAPECRLFAEAFR